MAVFIRGHKHSCVVEGRANDGRGSGKGRLTAAADLDREGSEQPDRGKGGLKGVMGGLYST